jgi:hypothetical protein
MPSADKELRHEIEWVHLTTGLGYSHVKKLSVGFVSNVVINDTPKNGKDKLILYQLQQSWLLWQVTEVKDFVIRDEPEKKNNFRSQDSLIRKKNKY